ncbi:helix-turn-helix domain-containing protein [Enterobacter ludwigii]|uniref:Transcriptional Regulator n=1 Tax=Enterobacter ludwigii TaxID=299767 RepID=G8LFF0_9ENTR|nr:helix-turn-helix domain-containing protein [Enterobacter ludwigii]AEW75318.1 Transcriptional Regulator [Enterobacter ludwigii]MBK1518716.1 helix-turn-helix domain-containing protein [Enterobacter ludwigii]
MTDKVNIMTDSGADIAQVSLAVATRIRNWRKEKKLSLDELSRRASVSKGMLVEIEKGAANPSIAILCKLAAALGVSVADIVNVSSEPRVHVIEEAAIPVLWQGPLGGYARLLAGTSGPDMIELWQWVMHPGERFTSPGHPAGTFELLHVTEGGLTLTVEETVTQVAAGASAVAKTEAAHGYANEGENVLRFTMTVAEFHR